MPFAVHKQAFIAWCIATTSFLRFFCHQYQSTIHALVYCYFVSLFIDVIVLSENATPVDGARLARVCVGVLQDLTHAHGRVE